MKKGTYAAYEVLKKAMDAQERFGVDTEYHGVGMDERTTIDRAIYEVLHPFYERRVVAVYEAAKAFVAAYEADNDTGDAHTVKALMEGSKC